MSPPVSIVILTCNEETNIADCLASLAHFDDVHVLDSGSADGTVEIAKSKNVPVHFNAFRGFGQQRNWAIDHIPAKYDWQFHLDADERMTPELTAELAHIAGSMPTHAGYHVPSKLIFAGRWLKHAGQYPGYQVRFFHKRRLRFIDFGHGQREETTGSLGVLSQPVIHLGFSKGLDDWFHKHVRYARLEAEQALAAEIGAATDSLVSSESVKRRRALKRLSMRLPGRYFLRLAYMLLVRRAMFDGWAGISYAHMMASYEGIVDVYLRLLKRGIDPDQLG
jgi:glycosyltransferase involved in cell wall biosynthesis